MNHSLAHTLTGTLTNRMNAAFECEQMHEVQAYQADVEQWQQLMETTA